MNNQSVKSLNQWKSVVQTTLSYDRLKAHGGEISLNRALKSGAEFIITFPIAM